MPVSYSRTIATNCSSVRLERFIVRTPSKVTDSPHSWRGLSGSGHSAVCPQDFSVHTYGGSRGRGTPENSKCPRIEYLSGIGSVDLRMNALRRWPDRSRPELNESNLFVADRLPHSSSWILRCFLPNLRPLELPESRGVPTPVPRPGRTVSIICWLPCVRHQRCETICSATMPYRPSIILQLDHQRVPN